MSQSAPRILKGKHSRGDGPSFVSKYSLEGVKLQFAQGREEVRGACKKKKKKEGGKRHLVLATQWHTRDVLRCVYEVGRTENVG